MSAYFIDLDGTTVHWHTSKWLPGFLPWLKGIHRQWHDIIFITARNPKDFGEEWSEEKAQELIEELRNEHGIPCRLLTCVNPNRILVDDSPGSFIKRERNEPWEEESK